MRAALRDSSAKGAKGWMHIDTANVYYDHPYHAPLDHALGIDFICEAEGGRDRVAVEISAESARTASPAAGGGGSGSRKPWPRWQVARRRTPQSLPNRAWRP